MRPWMIGLVVAIVAVGFAPMLPPWEMLVLLAVVAAAAVAVIVAIELIVVPLPKGAPCSARFRLSPAYAIAGLAMGSIIAVNFGYALLDRRLPEACVKFPLRVVGQVSSLPLASSMAYGKARQRFEFAVSSMALQECMGPSRLLLNYYGDASILPGQYWRFTVSLKRPWGLSNPGSHNMQAWFAQRGIDAIGSVRGDGAALSEAEATQITSTLIAHHSLRYQLREAIARLPLSADVRAVLQALIIADKSAVDSTLWKLFQRFGVNHLLVISGLHVGLVGGVAYVGASLLLWGSPRTFRLPHSLPSIAAVVAAFAYTALAGFSLPTVRALCMLAAFAVAQTMGRPSQAANNLLLAAVVLLVSNPLAALGSGFWLSFGAVSALLWLGHWQRGGSRLWQALGTHGYMSIVMLPLGAWYFDGASVVSMLANIVMIPLVGLVVVPLALLGAACNLYGSNSDWLLWMIAGEVLDGLLHTLTSVSDYAGEGLFQSFTASGVAVTLALLGVILLILPFGSRLRLLSLTLPLPLLLGISLPAQPPELTTRVTVLDVGQGTAVVIRSGDRALLYDTGGGDPSGYRLSEHAVLPFLREVNVGTLDTLIISHADLDHSAGATDILRDLPVARVRFGGTGYSWKAGRPCLAGEAWRWPGGQEFQFLSPVAAMPGGKNDSSCVLQVQIGPHRLLLSGDAEHRTEQALVQYWGSTLRSDWLLVAHHGSKTSSFWSFLKTVRPSEGVISAGYANRFGHPHPDVMARLAQASTHTASTAQGGALTYIFKAEGEPVLSRHRTRVQRYWM